MKSLSGNYSILMSVYKNDKAEFLSTAIESMLKQTIKSNDFVIVRDGPLNSDLENTLKNYAQKNNQIHIVGLEDNSGLGKALDYGLSFCKNELVARMDADDISLPDRCEKLLNKFNSNPSLSIVGTDIDEFIDDPAKPISSRVVPTTDIEIKKYIRKRSPFNHPTVMFKKSEVIRCGGYGPLKRKQDMDLFSRMLNMGCVAENIPESLLLFRANEENWKRRRSKEYRKNTIDVAKLNYKRKYISIFDLLYIVIGQYALCLIPSRILNKLLRKEIGKEKKKNTSKSIALCLLLVCCSSLIFCLTYFGINKSSLTSLERWCHTLPTQEGSNTCVAYYLKDESEGKRKSLIEPVNEYNSYRTKELRRSVSFVRDESFTFSIESNVINAQTIVYGDYFNNRFTSSRLSILSGSLSKESFDSGKQVFLSQGLYNDLTKLGYSDIVDKEVALSLNPKEKFIIGGVVGVNGLSDLGVHIRHFYSDKFILLGSKNVYEFDFTDLIFGSDEYHFADDLLDFERKIKSSYLDYRSVSMRYEFVEGTNIVKSDVFNINGTNKKEIWTSIFSVTCLALLALIEIGSFLLFKPDHSNLTMKLIIFFGGILAGFVPLILGVYLMRVGYFISRIAISIIILHSAEYLMFVLFKSGIFNRNEIEK